MLTRLHKLILALAVFGAAPALAYADVDAGVSAVAVDTVVKDVGVLVAQAHSTTGWHLALAGLIAFALKWILDFLMHLTNPRDEVKRALPWVLGALGIIVGVLDFYVRGASWIDAIIIGGGPPGATLFNELMNSLRKKLEKPSLVTTSAVLLLCVFGTSSCACWTSQDPAVYNSTKCVLQRQSVQCFVDGVKDVSIQAKDAILQAIATGTVDTAALIDIAKKMGVSDGECLLALIANSFSAKPQATAVTLAFVANFNNYAADKYGMTITYKLPEEQKYTVHR